MSQFIGKLFWIISRDSTKPLDGHSQGHSGRAKLNAKLQSHMLDLLLITGLSWKEVLSQEESAVKEEGKLASLQRRSDERPDVDSTFRREGTTNGYIQNEMQKCAEQSVLVGSENCSKQMIEIETVKEQCGIIVLRYAS